MKKIKIKDWYKCEIFDENKYEWPITEWNNSQESDVLLVTVNDFFFFFFFGFSS